MAGSGMILGGLLGGIGKGMEMTALQAREDMLERLRQQRKIEDEGRQEETLIRREDRLEGRVIAQEGRAEERDIRSDKRDYVVKTGLLKLAQEHKMKENETEFEYKARLEKLKQEGDARLARLKSGLDRSNEAAAIRLRASLDADDVDSTEVDASGNIVILYKNGKTEVTSIKAKPTAGELKAEEEAAEEERRAARRAKRNGTAEPAKKTEDFVDLSAMVQQLADARFGGNYSAAAAWVQQNPAWKKQAEASLKGK